MFCLDIPHIPPTRSAGVTGPGIWDPLQMAFWVMNQEKLHYSLMRCFTGICSPHTSPYGDDVSTSSYISANVIGQDIDLYLGDNLEGL